MKKRLSFIGLTCLAASTTPFFIDQEILASENTAKANKGLVQLWQVVPEGQNSEGATTAQIMNQLKCRPNHDLYPVSGGKAAHNTYVNSCYVDDALYLGEDANSYRIYLAGYEGTVAKTKSHYFDLDLNNDGKKVKYEIQTVAYFIPDGGTTYNSRVSQEADILNYSTDMLDKDFSETVGIEGRSVTGTVKAPSYYANENGVLIHYLSNNVRGSSYSKTITGKAPSWMKANTRYYSYDNVYFYTDWRDIKVSGAGAVNASNPFYNYYQYLPFRTTSNATAADINAFTASYGYTSLPTSYPASGNQSKLVDAGKYFFNVQNNYGINGAMQYAMGIHESGWGRSSLSINKNNLFGMNATDNNPYGNGTSFPNVESGINYHADRYLSWGYTDPLTDFRYYGSHVGNKGSGMNVKYASDPFWGEKIAGWYYRFDQNAGLKDYNYYAIGIKQNDSKYNVRNRASNSATTLYQTYNKKSNVLISEYPVVLTGTSGDFYQIKSDTPIISGSAKYSGTYKWADTNVYLSKSAIDVVNHKNYKSPGLSDDAKLKALSSDKGTWSSSFKPTTTQYTITLDKYASEITLNGTLNHSGATVLSGLGTHALKPNSETEIAIKTQSSDGTKLTYKVKVINPDQSNNAMLKTLSSNIGTWNQAFDSKTTKYTITLPKYSDSITFEGALADSTATVVGGLGTHQLEAEKTNVIKIQTRSQKGTLLTYEISVVNPRKSNNAMFKTISTNVGTWNQSYDRRTTKYTITLPKYQDSITFSGTLADSTATYVGGLGTHQLAPDSTTVIKVQSRSQKGTLLTYEFTVVNPRQSNNAMFKTISTNVGTWSQKYNKRTTKYTITLPKYQDSITFSGVLADETATYIGGLGTHPLAPDSTTVIKVQSRSQKGTLLTYEFTVVNPRMSNNAMFKTIKTNTGKWNQKYDKRTTKYTITLPKYSESITFSGSLADSTATYIGGLETHRLVEGTNIIKVQSRSQKGTLLTYQFTVVNPAKK